MLTLNPLNLVILLLLLSLNSEHPPAYKDLVAMAVINPMDFDSRSLHGDGDFANQSFLLPMTTLPPSTAFKSERNVDEDVKEAIAFLPSAADMHQRIIIASIASEWGENLRQSASV